MFTLFIVHCNRSKHFWGDGEIIDRLIFHIRSTKRLHRDDLVSKREMIASGLTETK